MKGSELPLVSEAPPAAAADVRSASKVREVQVPDQPHVAFHCPGTFLALREDPPARVSTLGTVGTLQLHVI
jgi:hypothetical protein